MSSVISLRPDAGRPEARSVIDDAAVLLGVTPAAAVDGTLELAFSTGYAAAHAAVVDALGQVRPDWPALLTLEYALAV